MLRPAVVLAATVAFLSAATALSADDKTGVKLLTGFEWEEYENLGKWNYRGKPYLDPPGPGWKGEKLDNVEQAAREGFHLIDAVPSSSRHMPYTLCAPQHATQGRFAFRSLIFGDDSAIARGRTKYLESGVKEKFPPPWPAHEPTHDAHDHWYQREYQVYRQGFAKLDDWSGYQRLRFDVTSVGQPIMLGFRVRDGSGPRINPGPTGVRSGLVLFDVPGDETVTCDVPLAALAAVGEMDLSKIHRYNIRVNGLPSGKAPSRLFLDNIRLAAKDAEARPALKLIAPAKPVEPFARPVVVRPPTVRDAEKLKRQVGPVEPLGPVVINPNALYAGPLGHGAGHFGLSGATYFTNSRRAVVAYDDNRLLALIGARTGPGGKGSPASRGGTAAVASFDGGKTWGGLTPEDKDFTVLPWHLRSNFTADAFGNVYAVGTPNCDSYNEGQDICLHRLALTGATWVDDRFAILHQDGYKCPHNGGAMALPNGRIWAAWGDGFGGCFARSSDDDGFTFQPCKDASLPAPRPFHQPKLTDVGKPDAPAPPKSALLWPSQPVVGPLATPFREHIAVFALDAKQWQFHDGIKWSEAIKGPAIGRLLTVTTLGADRIFVCRGAGFSDPGNELLADLVVADLRGGPDGKWNVEKLEDANVTSAIVTASGEAVFCFYVRKSADDAYDICCRRFKNDKWEPTVKLTTDTRRANHLAAPQVCPSSYAAVWWDQHFRKSGDTSEVKFMRVPNKQ